MEKTITNYIFAFLIVLLLSAVSTLAQSNADMTAKAVTQASPGRSLGIASVPNLRDLGGYRTADGHTVASGLVYRSNQLSGISTGDMEKLAALKLKNAYDLRTVEEREERPEELPPGVNYVVLDVLADSPQAGPAQLEKLMADPKAANATLGGGKVAAAFEKSYREFVSLPSANRGFRELFLSLGDKAQLPALFHCTTGKDRTGWAAAAFLTLMGVPRDKVYEDYLRSNDYILTAYQKPIDAFVAAGGDPEIPRAILGVQQAYLDAAFDEMQTKYGSIENYFSEGLGINTTRQKALRALYLQSDSVIGAKKEASLSGSRVDILQSWQGDYPVAQLHILPETQRQLAVGFIDDAETFTDIWKAFKPGEDVPQIDFNTSLVLFARNTQFYNRISIGQVNLKGGVAEVIAMETMSAMPIEDRVAMSLVVLPRQGIAALQAGDDTIPVKANR